MDKQALKRNLLIRGGVGAMAGVFISQVVCVIVSLLFGAGEVLAVPAGLAEQLGSEIAAFIWQNLACMLYGSVWAMASIVWELDWSLMKQTRIHWMLCSGSALPIAWLMHWFPHTWQGVLGYSSIFLLVYALNWAVQYLLLQRHLRAVNSKLKQQ